MIRLEEWPDEEGEENEGNPNVDENDKTKKPPIPLPFVQLCI